MTATDIQALSIGTLYPAHPFDKPFTPEEASHILELISNPTVQDVRLQHFTSAGKDGETFHFVGIRRKDGRIPLDVSEQVQRIYADGLVSLGFIDLNPQSLQFVKEFWAAGFEIDPFFWEYL